jgi:hypothetical protein
VLTGHPCYPLAPCPSQSIPSHSTVRHPALFKMMFHPSLVDSLRPQPCRLPLQIDGDLIEAPKPLPWYPHKLAWQFDFSRSQVRSPPRWQRPPTQLKA